MEREQERKRCDERRSHFEVLAASLERCWRAVETLPEIVVGMSECEAISAALSVSSREEGLQFLVPAVRSVKRRALGDTCTAVCGDETYS